MAQLNSIRETVQKYADIVSKVSKLDVEVVDNELIRVAGTGIFGGKIGEDVSSLGHVYKAVLASGEAIIVDNPGESEYCMQCKLKGSCRETFEISTPIRVKDEIVGVIGMITTTEESKDMIRGDLDSYLSFIEQIADFISIKLNEITERQNTEALLQTLKLVTYNMDEGAIIINRDDRVETINKSAKKQLGIERTVMQEAIEITETGDTVNNSKEYNIRIGANSSTVIGDIYEVDGDSMYKKVLLFRDLKRIRSNIYAMTSVINAQTSDSIIGMSRKMQVLKREIGKIAQSSSTVLITGESGTGKELVATAIWKNSDRADKRFVAINCAAIPESLLESELFGYVKGAFTGADPNGRIGKFELANEGVIFLDEIGDMPLYLQSKLLRVIQDRKVVRIGSNRQIPLDVRIIAATNKDLKQMIRENKFREDLYYRLNVIPIEIPPLRERIEDIEELLINFIEFYRTQFGKSFSEITDEAMDILKSYSWPGNVRELENVAEYMVNMMENGRIERRTIPSDIVNPYKLEAARGKILTLKEIERREIKKAVEHYGDTTEGKESAAKALGIGIATLYRHLKSETKKS